MNIKSKKSLILNISDELINKNIDLIFPKSFLEKISYHNYMDIQKAIVASNSDIPKSKKTFVFQREAMKKYPFLDWQKLNNWVEDGLVDIQEVDNDPNDAKFNLIITKKVQKYALEDFKVLAEKDYYLDLAVNAGALARINTIDGTKWVWRNVRRWDMKDQTNEVRVLTDLAKSWFGRLAYLQLLDDGAEHLSSEEFSKFITLLDKALPISDEKIVKSYKKKSKTV
jgi:hypothetical protein